MIVADPKLTPFNCAAWSGVVDPCGMKTLDVMVAMDGALLARAIVTPPTGAGVRRLTAKGTD